MLESWKGFCDRISWVRKVPLIKEWCIIDVSELFAARQLDHHQWNRRLLHGISGIVAQNDLEILNYGTLIFVESAGWPWKVHLNFLMVIWPAIYCFWIVKDTHIQSANGIIAFTEGGTSEVRPHMIGQIYTDLVYALSMIITLVQFLHVSTVRRDDKLWARPWRLTPYCMPLLVCLLVNTSHFSQIISLLTEKCVIPSSFWNRSIHPFCEMVWPND